MPAITRWQPHYSMKLHFKTTPTCW